MLRNSQEFTEKDYFAMGHAHFEKKEYNEAIVVYTAAITINPRYASAFNARGLCYLKLNQLEQAENDYNKAIEINPTFAVAHYNKGLIYHSLERYAEAIACYTKAIDLYPYFARAYLHRGNAYNQTYYHKNEIENYLFALWIKPKYSLVAEHLRVHEKETVFDAIKTLPVKMQIRLLTQCLNKDCVLGEFFWKPRGSLQCDIDSGTLMKINQHRSALINQHRHHIYTMFSTDEKSLAELEINFDEKYEKLHQL